MRRFTAHHRSDEGFTLVELIVTMVVISTVLLGLMAVQFRALVTTSLAKQREQATAVGNQVMESVRALPYEAMRKGTNPSMLTGDPNVVSGRFRPTASIDEELVTDAGQQNLPPLAAATAPYGNVTTVTDTYGGATVTFTARAYITKTTASTSTPYWGTVVVTWSSNASHNAPMKQVLRSQLYSPAGCLSLQNRPFSGPCQAYLYASAAAQTGTLSLSSPGAGLPVLGGGTDTSAAVALPTAAGNLAVEQVTQTSAAGSTSNARSQVGTTLTSPANGASGRTRDTDDPSETVTAADKSATLTQAAGTATVSGTLGTVSLTSATGDTGSMVSTRTAGSPACADVDGTAMSGTACSNAAARQMGIASLSWDPAAIDGRNLPAFVAASVDAAPASSIGWTGRYLATPGSVYCKTLLAVGCSAGGASVRIGTVTAGTLPAAIAGDTAPAYPSGFTQLVKVSGYTAKAVTEAGPGSNGPTVTAVAPTVARAGTIEYVTSAGKQTLTLTPTTDVSVTLATLSGQYAAGASTFRVEVSGSLRVTPAVTTRTAPDPQCASQACQITVTVPAVAASLTYVVTSGAGEVGRFTTQVELGSVLSTSSYKAAPSA